MKKRPHLTKVEKILFRIDKNIIESIVHNYIFHSLNRWFYNTIIVYLIVPKDFIH